MPLKASKYAITVLVFECTHELQIAQLTWIILLLVLTFLVSNLCYKLLLIVNPNLSQQWHYLALSILMRASFINDIGWSLNKMNKSLYNSCSVTQLCLTVCDPMDCRMPGFPVLQHLPELAQTHVHWVSDAIHSSNCLLSPSPAFNLSHH